MMKDPPSPRVLVLIVIGSLVLAGVFLFGFFVLKSMDEPYWTTSFLMLAITCTEIAIYAVLGPLKK
jgi:NADH:ubiquinone oxidoreductase subunit 5 (subunit L)/multisubunit Na+/H+ antiporter MnhA subunit